MGRKWSEEQVNRWNKAMSDRQGWERLKNLMTWQSGHFERLSGGDINAGNKTNFA